MNIASFASLLHQGMGLDAASIGNSAIERAVQIRIAACKAQTAARYLELVSNSPTELQSLIEEVVIPETWFFRDREAYTALAACAVEQWLPAHPEGELRLLSLPCSTGEEPYSMAMALLQAGFPADRYSIDAVDISAAALSRAQRAEYGKNSFRGADLAFRERFFVPTAQGYRLDAAVQRRVTFQQGNLLNADAMRGIDGYDCIFCRNLLIYFDRPGQDRAVRQLRNLLLPGGVLFVGPSESGLMFDHDFVSLRVRLAFGFRAGDATPAPPTTAPRPVATAPVAPRANGAKHAPAIVRSTEPAGQPALLAAAIEAASQLADRGELAAAAQACHALLRHHADSVAVLHLMGLIRAAEGDAQAAVQSYRKALYLDPTHHDTLLHLGLLLEKQGDVTAARLLRDRLRRLTPGVEAS
ncbi:MAG: protein-glutamate O-methyltransferase CheR [Pseudomonadota bacterium]